MKLKNAIQNFRMLSAALVMLTTVLSVLSQKCNAQLGKVAYHFQSPNKIESYILIFSDQQSVYFNGRSEKKETQEIQSVDENGNTTFNVERSDEEGYTYYKDFLSNELIYRSVRDRVIPPKPFRLVEKMPKWDWKITEQQKQIGRFVCQLATTEYKGRVYDAWFTREIPLPHGPWKLGGLPGLIIEAQDSEGLYRFKAESVEYPTRDLQHTIERPKSGQEISWDEYANYYRNGEKYLNDMVRTRLAAKGMGDADFQITIPQEPSSHIEGEVIFSSEKKKSSN